jgi:hypothetical protein
MTKAHRIGVLLVLLGLAACAGLPSIPPGQQDTSPLVHPPNDWDSALTFMLMDSAHAEFFDGRRSRTVTSRDGVRSDSTFGRTPWYRIWTADSLRTTVHVTASFGALGSVAADYQLTIRPDGYYDVWVVRTADNPRTTIMGATGARSFALPPGVARTAADSLWIFTGTRPKRCFDCPI